MKELFTAFMLSVWLLSCAPQGYDPARCPGVPDTKLCEEFGDSYSREAHEIAAQYDNCVLDADCARVNIGLSCPNSSVFVHSSDVAINGANTEKYQAKLSELQDRYCSCQSLNCGITYDYQGTNLGCENGHCTNWNSPEDAGFQDASGAEDI